MKKIKHRDILDVITFLFVFVNIIRVFTVPLGVSTILLALSAIIAVMANFRHFIRGYYFLMRKYIMHLYLMALALNILGFNTLNHNISNIRAKIAMIIILLFFSNYSMKNKKIFYIGFLISLITIY